MQADLPHMPSDIINTWLIPHYNRFGWPPKIDNEWRFILGPGNDLSFLQQLTWHHQEIALTPQKLKSSDRQRIIDMFRTHVLGQRTIYSSMCDGPERFRNCCDYIKSNKKFPHPVVLMQRPDGYEVFDGNHRLTSFFYLYGWFKVENDETRDPALSDVQCCWIGSLR